MKIAAPAACLSIGFVLAALAGSVPGQGQTQAPAAQAVSLDKEPHHHLVYENDDLRIFDVVVPPHQSTLLHQHDNDYIYVVLGASRFTTQIPGQANVELSLPDGAVRFSKGGFVHTLINDGDQPFHDITVEFLDPHTTGRGCTCSGDPAGAVCDCPSAPPLPSNWTLRIGQLLLGEDTLVPGGQIEDTIARDTRFLIGVTPLDILDVSSHEARGLRIRLPAGRFHWLSPGPHKIQNLSEQPIRFVTVAF